MSSSSSTNSGIVQWPSDLPAPLIGVQHVLDPRSAEAVVETERIRRRRTFNVPVELIQVSWNFTKDQYSSFLNFFDNTLVRGQRLFTLTTMEHSGQPGLSYEITRTLAFNPASYKLAHENGLFVVNATLEVTSEESVEVANEELLPSLKLDYTDDCRHTIELSWNYKLGDQIEASWNNNPSNLYWSRYLIPSPSAAEISLKRITVRFNNDFDQDAPTNYILYYQLQIGSIPDFHPPGTLPVHGLVALQPGSDIRVAVFHYATGAKLADVTESGTPRRYQFWQKIRQLLANYGGTDYEKRQIKDQVAAIVGMTRWFRVTNNGVIRTKMVRAEASRLAPPWIESITNVYKQAHPLYYKLVPKEIVPSDPRGGDYAQPYSHLENELVQPLDFYIEPRQRWEYFREIVPGSPATAGYPDQVSNNWLGGKTEITIGSPDSGVQIRWTRDGSDPTADMPWPPKALEGSIYNIGVYRSDFAGIVKARCFKGGCKSPMTAVVVDRRHPVKDFVGLDGNGLTAWGYCDLAILQGHDDYGNPIWKESGTSCGKGSFATILKNFSEKMRTHVASLVAVEPWPPDRRAISANDSDPIRRWRIFNASGGWHVGPATWGNAEFQSLTVSAQLFVAFFVKGRSGGNSAYWKGVPRMFEYAIFGVNETDPGMAFSVYVQFQMYLFYKTYLDFKAVNGPYDTGHFAGTFPQGASLIKHTAPEKLRWYIAMFYPVPWADWWLAQYMRMQFFDVRVSVLDDTQPTPKIGHSQPPPPPPPPEPPPTVVVGIEDWESYEQDGEVDTPDQLNQGTEWSSYWYFYGSAEAAGYDLWDDGVPGDRPVYYSEEIGNYHTYWALYGTNPLLQGGEGWNGTWWFPKPLEFLIGYDDFEGYPEGSFGTGYFGWFPFDGEHWMNPPIPWYIIDYQQILGEDNFESYDVGTPTPTPWAHYDLVMRLTSSSDDRGVYLSTGWKLRPLQSGPILWHLNKTMDIRSGWRFVYGRLTLVSEHHFRLSYDLYDQQTQQWIPTLEGTQVPGIALLAVRNFERFGFTHIEGLAAKLVGYADEGWDGLYASGNWTIRFWFQVHQTNGFPSLWGYTKTLTGGASDTVRSWELKATDPAKFVLKLFEGPVIVESAPNAFQTFTWHRLVLRSIRGVGLQLFIDNNLVATAQTSERLIPFSPGFNLEARLPLHSADDTRVLLKDLVFWNSALTDSQLDYDWNSGNGRIGGGLARGYGWVKGESFKLISYLDESRSKYEQFKYWRLQIDANAGAASTVGTYEFELRPNPGDPSYPVANPTHVVSMTATGSNTGFGPEKAFDGSYSGNNGWLYTNNGAWPVWLQVQLQNPIPVLQYAVGSALQSDIANRSPRNWRLQGSHDGVTWYTVHVVEDQTGWTSGESRVFTR